LGAILMTDKLPENKGTIILFSGSYISKEYYIMIVAP
jgi:hypothetical protein